MAGNRSFKDYVADRFENELFGELQSYIGDNYKNLDLRLYRVRTIGGIELSDIEVKFVSVSDLPDMKIEFDFAIEAELEVSSRITKGRKVLACSVVISIKLTEPGT